MPENVKKRVKEIFYPNIEEDILKICIDVGKSLFEEEEITFSENEEKNMEYLGNFMIHFNDKDLQDINKWSLRDFKKIVKRYLFQQKKDQNLST